MPSGINAATRELGIDRTEALHPETKHGTPGVSRQVGDTHERSSESRFTADTAARTGQSERSVQSAPARLSCTAWRAALRRYASLRGIPAGGAAMLPAPPGAGLGAAASRAPASMTTMPVTVPRSTAGQCAIVLHPAAGRGPVMWRPPRAGLHASYRPNRGAIDSVCGIDCRRIKAIALP